ncbi:MAG: YidC/Oxa1 family membrane protein insertase [Candidatus Gracilibacteria bacterium]|nr:YidC/Oxa1 family membrane protein insertase [Candidatus Gracilibacteria bacterium]
MKKFLDILMIVALTLLVVNIFSGDKTEITNKSVSFEFNSDSYNIPASVILKIVNNSDEAISFNTCENIKINNSGSDIKFSESFCKDITLNSSSGTTIDYSTEYEKFFTTGKYNLSVNYDDKQFYDQFELDNKGTFKKIFVGLFYAPIYNLMIFLLSIFGGVFGWAILSITIIIRLILLYPQHKMMVSQKKLQAIQPKIKEIQKEHKGNQAMIGQKLMELYKTEKVNPMGSCGFLIIQMPILLVIYNIILGIKDPSSFYYVYSFLSDFKLDSIKYDFFGLDLLSSGGIGGLILALTVALVQFLQVKLSLADKNKNLDNKGVVLEKKSGEDNYSQFMPDPEMMNKFMLYGMPAMVGVFTYSLFAGVGIYWGISTGFMLLQQLIVNKMLQK